jgi:SAP domain-containing new25
MTLTQFDNGYWYTNELKEFAQTIGIPSASKLRKDELEKAIKFYLQTGKIESPTQCGPAAPGDRHWRDVGNLSGLSCFEGLHVPLRPHLDQLHGEPARLKEHPWIT